MRVLLVSVVLCLAVVAPVPALASPSMIRLGYTNCSACHFTPQGGGLRNATVTLTDTDGRVRTTVTGTFGVYRFTDVEVGRTYFLTVQSKKYFFADPTRIVAVNSELTNIDFRAEE